LVSVKPLEKLSAKIDDMKESLDKLAPLAPVADQLASVPAKVVTLQSAAFENSEQIRALNLALIRVEKAQRDGKGLALEETSDANHASEPPKGPDPAAARSQAAAAAQRSIWAAAGLLQGRV
jgi:hypothetical protein